MRYGSVCSGIEAATAAWHPLGWQPAFFSEIDKFPRQVLAHRYPEVPLHGDFTTIQKGDYAAIDLLVGGTPCQSFSVAGLRKGLDDPRGNLMLEFGALARRLGPKWLVWENVPGVLSSNGGRDFGSFIGMLGELGYGFAYRVLDAQYFGVPQRRRRVFVVGCLGDWRSAAAVLFERHSLSGDIAPRREAGQSVAGTITAGAFSGGAGGRVDGAVAEHFQAVGFECGPSGVNFIDTIPTLDAGCKDGPIRNQIGAGVATLCIATGQAGAEIGADLAPTLNCNHEAPYVTYGIPGNWIGRKPENGGNAVEPMHDVSPCLTKTDQHAVAFDLRQVTSPLNRSRAEDGRPSPTISAHSQISVAVTTPTLTSNGDAHTGFRDEHGLVACFKGGQGDRAGGIAYSEITAPTLTDGQSGSNQVPTLLQLMAVRRLIPMECERLQGFPDNFTRIPTWNGWRKLDASETPEQCMAEGLEVKQNKKTGKWRVKDVDGPRYKALGNSMAVPVMHWIGQRIDQVEKLTNEIRLAA